MFEIPAGVEVQVFPPGVDPNRRPYRLQSWHTTREARLYDKHEVAYDPLSGLGRGRWRKSKNHYGFIIDAPGNKWHGGIVVANCGQLKYDGEWMDKDNEHTKHCRHCGFLKCPDGCCCGC